LLELNDNLGPLFFAVGPANRFWRPQFAGLCWSCSKLLVAEVLYIFRRLGRDENSNVTHRFSHPKTLPHHSLPHMLRHHTRADPHAPTAPPPAGHPAPPPTAASLLRSYAHPLGGGAPSCQPCHPVCRMARIGTTMVWLAIAPLWLAGDRRCRRRVGKNVKFFFPKKLKHF
jgi:hypothetical protein